MRISLFARVVHFLMQRLRKRGMGTCQDRSQGPLVIPRTQHCLSRSQIAPNALKVLYRLHKAGYQAFLVGGGVRDLLLGRQPKDFDITTNATPEQVRALFRNCRLVGRRFRLAHVLFGAEKVEVATFRGHHAAHAPLRSRQGRLLRDNVYGVIEEDAHRRDFTINSLYYNVADFTVRDYTGGLSHLQQGVVHLIGNVEHRYREDPVRMLRAIRFAVQLHMQIDADTAAPIRYLAPLLSEIPAARLFEETLKLLHTGFGCRAYQLLKHYQLLQYLFPVVVQCTEQLHQKWLDQMFTHALHQCDQQIAGGQSVQPAFLLAALLWYPLLVSAYNRQKEQTTLVYSNLATAIYALLERQCRALAIPRYLSAMMREIWQLQLRLARKQGRQAMRLMAHPYFHPAFALLLLRANIEGGDVAQLAIWWRQMQHCSPRDAVASMPKRSRRRSVQRGTPPTKRLHDSLLHCSR